MLSPEIWNIEPSEQVVNYDLESLPKIAPYIITSHHFNYSVSIVLPDKSNIPQVLKNCILEDSDYYRVEALHVHQLVKRDFIDAFVEKGSLSLIAINRKVDVESSLAVTPSGHLVLSLDEFQYQCLGLEGKRSTCYRKSLPRHIVTIDLKDESFIPGRNNYERTLKCLQENLDISFDVIVSWDPPEEKLCPSSVASYFHSHGNSVFLCHQEMFQQTKYCALMPPLSLEDTNKFPSYFEWLGVFLADGNLVENESTQKLQIVSMATEEVGQVQYFGGSGFFSSSKVEKIFLKLKEYVSQNLDLKWCAMDVRGFVDAPVNWKLEEHVFHVDGNNGFTFIFFPNENCYLTCKSVSSKKILKS